MKAIKKSHDARSDRTNVTVLVDRKWHTQTTAPFQRQQESQVINLPYRCIKPHIEDLVSVSLQRHLGAPFKVTSDASWFEALFDPSLSNLAGICSPCTYIEIPQEELHFFDSIARRLQSCLLNFNIFCFEYVSCLASFHSHETKTRNNQNFPSGISSCSVWNWRLKLKEW